MMEYEHKSGSVDSSKEKDSGKCSYFVSDSVVLGADLMRIKEHKRRLESHNARHVVSCIKKTVHREL